MRIHEGMLDEIIKAQGQICELQRDVHLKPEKYSENMYSYFKLLEKDPKFNYIVNGTPMQLFNTYKQKLDDITKMTYNPEFSKKQNVLNVLEYIRIMTMYENVKQKCKDDRDIMNLSRYPIFLALLGKGFCYAQAKFTRDILNRMGIRAGDFDIDIYKSEYTNQNTGIPHQETLVELDGKYFYIDPTDYDGSLNGIQFSLQPQNKRKIESAGVRTDFSATQEEIKKSRDFVLPKLIEMLGIDEISKQLKLEGEDNLQKQCTIITFVESRLNLVRDIETQIISANLNGVNIEAGKLVELFFYQNNIEYDFECKSNRKNTIYKTKMGETEMYLCPAMLYSDDANDPGIRLRRSHFFKRDDKNVLMYSLNKSMEDTYIRFIEQGRVNSLELIVHTICEANDMDINIFMQKPIENIQKYAPEVNIDSKAMSLLVKKYMEETEKSKFKLTAQNIINSIANVGTRKGINDAMKELLEADRETSTEKYKSGMDYGGE